MPVGQSVTKADEWVIPEIFGGGYDFEHRPLSPNELDAGDAAADELIHWANLAELELDRRDEKIRKRWSDRDMKRRRDNAAAKILTAANELNIQTASAYKQLLDAKRASIFDSLGGGEPSPLEGDDIQPPADVIDLLKNDLESIGVPVGSEFRWCFVAQGAQKQVRRNDAIAWHYNIYCPCNRGVWAEPLYSPRLEDKIHTVELKGHTIRLGSGHLRIVFLGYCKACARVHWFELARPERPGEEDASVHVYRDVPSRTTYINGAPFSDQELLLRRMRR